MESPRGPPNPFSEAQFKTLKYRPEFPERFGSPEDAAGFCREFFRWYNMEHRHWGIALLTPYEVHYGLAELVIEARQGVLEEAFALHPERFVHGVPRPLELPQEVWINSPAPTRGQEASQEPEAPEPPGNVGEAPGGGAPSPGRPLAGPRLSADDPARPPGPGETASVDHVLDLRQAPEARPAALEGALRPLWAHLPPEPWARETPLTPSSEASGARAGPPGGRSPGGSTARPLGPASSTPSRRSGRPCPLHNKLALEVSQNH